MSKTSEDLRDVIFKSIEDVRQGRITPHQGRAVADLSKQLIDSGRLDLEHARLLEKKEVTAAVLVSQDDNSPPEITQNQEPAKTKQDAQDKAATMKQKIIDDYDDGVRPKDIAQSYNLKIPDVMRVINSRSPAIARHSNDSFSD